MQKAKPCRVFVFKAETFLHRTGKKMYLKPLPGNKVNEHAHC